jgi:hypothetical protein
MASRGSSSWRIETWGGPCETEQATIAIYEGCPKVTIAKEAVDAFKLLGRECLRFGYIVRRIGGYNCRKVTGSTNSWSAHAWGIAIDINDDTNPYRRDKLVTDMPRAFVAAVTSIRTVDGLQVFRWGGDWDGRPDTPHSNYDSMHFEIIVTRAELRRGFGGVVVPAPVTPGSTVPKIVAFPTLRPGDTGPAVNILQAAVKLQATSGAGVYGPRTKEAVRRYQESRGLTADGIAGPATWTALLSNMPPLLPGQPGPQK